MMSKLRLAAIACCALGVSAAVAPGQDATALVQGGLMVHGPGETARQRDVSMTRRVSGGYRVKSKTLAKGLLRAFLSDGRRWTKLLWGNVTEGTAGEPVPVAEDRAGCSAQDRESAAMGVQRLEEDLARNMQDMLPKIMEQMQGGGMGSLFGDAPALPLATPFGNLGAESQQEMSINVGDLIKLPPACSKVVSQQGDLEWTGLMSCAKEVLGVSTECLNCIPQFGKQVQDACSQMCSSAMDETASAVSGVATGMSDKMEKAASRSFGGMPTQQDMIEIAQGMQEALTSAMKKVVPCGECVAPKATSFAGCMGGEEAAKGAQQLGQDLIDALKSGDLMRVEVAGPGMGGSDQEGMVM